MTQTQESDSYRRIGSIIVRIQRKLQPAGRRCPSSANAPDRKGQGPQSLDHIDSVEQILHLVGERADLLFDVAELMRRGAIYVGRRIEGKNAEYTYESLSFKVPRMTQPRKKL
jgi:hypothetical protein